MIIAEINTVNDDGTVACKVGDDVWTKVVVVHPPRVTFQLLPGDRVALFRSLDSDADVFALPWSLGSGAELSLRSRGRAVRFGEDAIFIGDDAATGVAPATIAQLDSLFSQLQGLTLPVSGSTAGPITLSPLPAGSQDVRIT